MNRSRSLPFLALSGLWLAIQLGHAQEAPRGLRVESLRGEVAALSSSLGWRPLALGEASARPLRLGPSARAGLRHGGVHLVALGGTRLQVQGAGLLLERGQVSVKTAGEGYRIETRAGPLLLQRGQLEVAALTSGVFARVGLESRAEFAGGGALRELSRRWTRLAPWKEEDPGRPTRPQWPELPLALRDIHGYRAERVEVVALEARVDLEAGFARSEWRLTLRNPQGFRPAGTTRQEAGLQGAIEAVTPIPLPLGAAVTNLWVGQPTGKGANVVRGISRNHGFTVGGATQLALLEWSRGDLARLSVAPVTSEVTVTLEVVEPLPLEGGRYRFALPLGRPAWRGLKRIRCELRGPLEGLSANRTVTRVQRGSRGVWVYTSPLSGEGPSASREDLVVWVNPPPLPAGQVGLEVFAEDAPGPRAYMARIRPNLAPVQVHPERVFLVDTSLTPTPEAFAARVLALETLLDELPSEDFFALLAFDATCAALTPGFVRGPAARHQALARLRARASLGASDLEGGLLAAAELCRPRAPGQVVLISGGPPCFGELRATPLGRQVRERFGGWSISALSLGELRSEAHLEAIVAGRGLLLAAPSRGAGSAAFRLAHGLEYLEASLEVGFEGQVGARRALAPGGQVVFRGREGAIAPALELRQEGHAPRRLPFALPLRGSAGIDALVTRDEGLAEPHRERLAAFRREVRGEPPLKPIPLARVLLPQAALSAGSKRYGIWEELMGPRFVIGEGSEEVDPRGEGDPLWKLELDRLVRGRVSGRVEATAQAALALEVYYRVDRATEGKGSEPQPWPKENQEPLGEPKVVRVPVASVAAPRAPVLRERHPQLELARQRGAEIEAELAAPPPELDALYLERAPVRTRIPYSEFTNSEFTNSERGPNLDREYLARSANPDGSWGAPPSLVLTSRALLAFVGQGYTHRFGAFKRRVKASCLWLRRQQRPDGGFGRDAYEHAVASEGLFELSLVSRDPELRAPARRALERLLALQNEGGSWGEGERRPWASVEALRVLRLARLDKSIEKAPLLAARARALTYLNSITSPDGAVGPLGLPRGNEIDLTLTAGVATARVFAGAPAWDPRVRGAGAHLLTLTRRSGAEWYRERFLRDGYHLLWIGTELFYRIGGGAWSRWSKWMQKVLLPAQVTGGPYDGSWNPPSPKASEGARAEALSDLPRLLGNPALARQGEATSAALTSLCDALARVQDRALLESWCESEGLPPASRGCAGARRALLSEDAGQPLVAAQDWFEAWRGAGQSPAAGPFLLRAVGHWERERGGGYALLRVLAAPCKAERFADRLEVLLDVLLRQPERARRELIRGLPAQRPFEVRVRTALLAALAGLEEDPIRQVALLENLANRVGRTAPWERLATAYLVVGDPRGIEIRRALVAAGQQDLSTLVRLGEDAIEHLQPGESRLRAATSQLQIHWRTGDAAYQVLDNELGRGASVDLRLAALASPYFVQSDLGDVLLGLKGGRRDDAVELALALSERRDMTFELSEERRLRGIHFDGSPQLQAALERVLENDLEIVVAWENEASQVEFEVKDAAGSRVWGAVEEEEGRVLFLKRRESSSLRVEVQLPKGHPATRVHLKISQRRGGKRIERLWVFMLKEEGKASRSLSGR